MNASVVRQETVSQVQYRNYNPYRAVWHLTCYTISHRTYRIVLYRTAKYKPYLIEPYHIVFTGMIRTILAVSHCAVLIVPYRNLSLSTYCFVRTCRIALYLQLGTVHIVPYHIVLALYRTVLTYRTVLIVLKRTFRIASYSQNYHRTMSHRTVSNLRSIVPQYHLTMYRTNHTVTYPTHLIQKELTVSHHTKKCSSHRTAIQYIVCGGTLCDMELY